MAEVSWIKITTTMFDDEKIRLIESFPDADTILIIWIKLLTICGKSNAGGYIMLTEDIPYTDEMLSTIMNRPLAVVRLALKTFAEFGMIERTGQGIYLPNWEKHQNIEALERIREQTRKRVAKHREKQKELPEGNVTCNATVTPGNATDIDIDKEEDIDKEIIVLTAGEAEFIEILQGVKSYPLDREKDSELYQTLTQRYPELDILDVARDWAAYKLDKPLDAKSNPRSQLNTACKKAMEWGKNRRASPQPEAYTHEHPLSDLEKAVAAKTMKGL